MKNTSFFLLFSFSDVFREIGEVFEENKGGEGDGKSKKMVMSEGTGSGEFRYHRRFELSSFT